VIEDRYKCRVCGLDQSPDLPWGENGDHASFNICSCCGVEFGYEDDSVQNCLSVRRHWVEIRLGAWFAPKEQPSDWDMPAQIRAIPSAYKGHDDEELIRIYLETREQPLRGLSALDAIEKSGR
jgi:hypothetical protein